MTAAWLEARRLTAHALDRAAVAALLPQRPPLLLVDRVVAIAAPAQRPAAAAALDITGDEAVLAGHFPGRPVWPGAYTLEGLAQTCLLAGALCGGGAAPVPGSPALLVAAKIKLTALVEPPARLDYFVELTATVGNVLRFAVQASVGGRDVATGTLDVAFVEARP